MRSLDRAPCDDAPVTRTRPRSGSAWPRSSSSWSCRSSSGARPSTASSAASAWDWTAHRRLPHPAPAAPRRRASRSRGGRAAPADRPRAPRHGRGERQRDRDPGCRGPAGHRHAARRRPPPRSSGSRWPAGRPTPTCAGCSRRSVATGRVGSPRAGLDRLGSLAEEARASGADVSLTIDPAARGSTDPALDQRRVPDRPGGADECASATPVPVPVEVERRVAGDRCARRGQRPGGGPGGRTDARQRPRTRRDARAGGAVRRDARGRARRRTAGSPCGDASGRPRRAPVGAGARRDGESPVARQA